MTSPFRCAAASLERGEPLHSTASTVRAFLLVEECGPWGVDAVRDCRSLAPVSEELLRRAHATRVRVLLIRRHGRYSPDGIRVFAAYADAEQPWVETGHLGQTDELLDLDLPALAVGSSVGLSRHDRPLFCVCTHGRHDACCAEQGRPVARALATANPEDTWEVSHIGGDRFAGNVLVLPEGLYYGRVTADSAPGLAARHLDGRLDLDRLRGRSSRPFVVQAAEVMLRQHLGIDGLYDVRPVAARRLRREGGTQVHAVELATSGDARPWRVVLRSEASRPTTLTCRARRENAYPTYTLLEMGQVSSPATVAD